MGDEGESNRGGGPASDLVRQGMKAAMARWVIQRRTRRGSSSAPSTRDEATHTWNGQPQFAEDYTFGCVQPNLGIHKEFQDDQETLRFSRTEFTPVRHDWAESYSEIVSKERRYLALEGERRYSEGQRFSWARALFHTLRAVKVNLFDLRGLLGGFQGIALSGIASWLVWSKWQSLRRYEKSLG